ncbi:MAG: hypothetical protein AB7O91_12135 [Sphingomonas sp.]
MTKPAAGPTAPLGPSDAELAEAHRRLLGDSSIQFELKAIDPPQPPPQWMLSLEELLRSLWPVIEILLWVGLGALVLWILYLLAMRLKDGEWRWRRRSGGVETQEAWRPDEAPARQLLADADALAAAGRYSEAAHLLLFRSIEDIEARQPDLLRPALTSRDIAALEAVPERPRGAFARIAALVERGLFARQALAEADWRLCRSAYEEFAFAGGWRG